MGEGFPFNQIGPEADDAISGEQQNDFIDAVRLWIVSPDEPHIEDVSEYVRERHDVIDRDGQYAWFTASRESVYQPDGLTRIVCRVTPNEISLEHIAKGQPVAGHSGLFYATSDVYVVGQEASEKENQLATRYSDRVIAPLCIDAMFHRVDTPEGVELMTPSSQAQVRRRVADPDAQAINDVGAGIAGEMVFTSEDLIDVQRLLSMLTPGNLVS